MKQGLKEKLQTAGILSLLLLMFLLWYYFKDQHIRTNGQVCKAVVYDSFLIKRAQIFQYEFQVNDSTYTESFSRRTKFIDYGDTITVKYIKGKPNKSYPMFLLYPLNKKIRNQYRPEFVK